MRLADGRLQSCGASASCKLADGELQRGVRAGVGGRCLARSQEFGSSRYKKVQNGDKLANFRDPLPLKESAVLISEYRKL